MDKELFSKSLRAALFAAAEAMTDHDESFELTVDDVTLTHNGNGIQYSCFDRSGRVDGSTYEELAKSTRDLIARGAFDGQPDPAAAAAPAPPTSLSDEEVEEGIQTVKSALHKHLASGRKQGIDLSVGPFTLTLQEWVSHASAFFSFFLSFSISFSLSLTPTVPTAFVHRTPPPCL